LIAADDRTGALEVAAEVSRAGTPVTVTVGEPPTGEGVVDLGTRGLAFEQAVAAAAALPAAEWQGHKIDSTLRGNWAAELRARAVRTLIIPAWPAMGRTCHGGVVHVHGVSGAAVRDQLPEAALLAGLDALEGWLAAGDGIAAVDVSDTAALHHVAALAAGSDVLIAGPAGAIGAAFVARFGEGSVAVPPSLAAPVVVMCGSATAVSREQVDRLRRALPDVRVVDAPPAEGDLSPEVVRALAATADLEGVATLVVIGGDTAAAVLGGGPRMVGGYAAPGMPWSRDGHGGGPVVVSKAGGFGGPDALVDLLRGV
jgi:uncharacterized protein YgbK (DUF1537 family)